MPDANEAAAEQRGNFYIQQDLAAARAEGMLHAANSPAPPIYPEMSCIVHRMITIIESQYNRQFYFHALPGIACVAFLEENGPDAVPSKVEIKRLCNETLALLR